MLQGTTIPEHLTKEIVAGRCVAFVGAGFSAAARLPTWGALLGQMASEDGLEPDVVRYVNEALNTPNGSRFEEATQILYHALEREEFISGLSYNPQCQEDLVDELVNAVPELIELDFGTGDDSIRCSGRTESHA